MHAQSCHGQNIYLYSDNITTLKYAGKLSGTTSLILQRIALEIQMIISQYKLQNSRAEYRHRSTLQHPMELVPQDSTLGTTDDDRRLRMENGSQTPTLLELDNGTRGGSNRCFPTTTSHECPIFAPTLAPISSSFTQVTDRQVHHSAAWQSAATGCTVVP
ncbi:uncharacterized protein BYT42DRAFT_543531 [Radiomyces spectabilis]|uniref:uncharacterized protein n=1 Tax=Radiomyces spectabilis TaxID=64574 RepID=UPI0022211FD6|nr:uncharacterized protein BYT42DRAFT_543531 [Radiomyces spectabilis]KAI8388180.1 hypothetical protein BYT42DRAFT_543531 [Radiomyces spectabilis]